MNDTVKFIFKSLLKVPIIIFISYFIFNLFAFTLTYFKMLGISYSVMQTGIENNYIPPEEKSTLENYMEEVNNSTTLLETNSVKLTNNTTTTKQQYGKTVTCGVQANYVWVWPLMPKEQTQGETGMIGLDSSKTMNWLNDSELSAKREDSQHKAWNQIVIEYKVPGLQYYPDLE